MTIKERCAAIDAEIARLKKEKEELNPFANLNDLSNKAFGEEWSETFICSRCPSFIRKDEKGWDFWSDALGRVEVKSTRNPEKFTFNQCHPYDCDYFLFVAYDTEEGTQHIFLVPSSNFFDMSTSVQHSRDKAESAKCFSVSSTKKTKEVLEKYRIDDWEELEKIAGGK